MRKRTWMDVGIAVLGLFLVCSAVQDVAQEPGTGQAGGTQQATNIEAVQRQEISRLQAEVERLQQEVTRMRARLAEAGLPTQGGTDTGTGGAGSAGIGDPSAEAPAGQVGLGDPEGEGEGVGGSGRAGGAQAARPDTANEGTAVANIIYTGRIRSVSPEQLILDVEEGLSNNLPLARDVRVFRGRKEVAFKTIPFKVKERTASW
ncbi:hypothetical protein [Archangium sp.]|uniref:hypothetical protein n=1 Tax=Archangium sp. TaxID=1872627 RepID=UPI00286BCC6C|nr:hypothetical protein [Archangium sp.]